MLRNVHTLVWNANNIDSAIRHDVKNEMMPFGEAKIARLYVTSGFASTGVVSQPISEQG